MADKILTRPKGQRKPPKPTHFVYNGVVARGGKGSGKGTADVPKFGPGWRTVRLEKLGSKYAHVIETGTGVAAKIELDTWKQLVRGGRTLEESV